MEEGRRRKRQEKGEKDCPDRKDEGGGGGAGGSGPGGYPDGEGVLLRSRPRGDQPEAGSCHVETGSDQRDKVVPEPLCVVSILKQLRTGKEFVMRYYIGASLR